MKLLTLNTHSLIEPDYEVKREIFVNFIAAEQPEVFALQEVNQTAAAPLLGDAPAGYYPCLGNRVPLKADNHAAAVAKMLEQRGVHYDWSWLPAKIGYDIYDEGAAVFSRAPITDAENLLLSKISDYSNWKTRRTLGICAGDVWYYTVHLGWWKDEVEPFAPQWEKLSQAAGAKKTAFLLGDFNSEADVRGEGYDLVRRSGWQDTYQLAQQRDEGYTVVEAIDGWRDAPDAAAKKRIDQIWCSKAVAVKSSRVVFGGLQEPQVSDHAGVMIEYKRKVHEDAEKCRHFAAHQQSAVPLRHRLLFAGSIRLCGLAQGSRADLLADPAAGCDQLRRQPVSELFRLCGQPLFHQSG